jgi:DNA-binding SARP family transcriptional activator
VEFRILGPLEVLADGRPLPIAGEKQRALLALLLLHANEVVSSDCLLDQLWGERPPAAGATALRVRVSQLRKALGVVAERLETKPPGYRLRLTSGELDLDRFSRLLEEATGAEPTVAAERLRDALALWRGPALEELADQQFAQVEIARLEELRLTALELRLEADLALARHAGVIAELEALVRQHPLRERLRAQLMVALYRSERQVDALAVYTATRRTLIDELGIEPSPTLQDLQRAILAHDRVLDAPLRGRVAELPRTSRAILVVARENTSLDPLLPLAEILARRPEREVIAAVIVEVQEDLAHAARALNERRQRLLERGLGIRAAAFTSTNAAADILRLSAEQPVDLLLIGTDEASVKAGFSDDLRTVLAGSPCDVALLAAGSAQALDANRPVVVPFGGLEHDWAAVELAAWAASALGTRVRLIGATADATLGRRDASRLLAAAALSIQRAFGVAAEPALVQANAEAVAAAAEEAALLVLGLSRRWPEESVGPVREAIIAAARSPTVLVKAGLRPGGLAPQESRTRFTWSVAGPTG